MPAFIMTFHIGSITFHGPPSILSECMQYQTHTH